MTTPVSIDVVSDVVCPWCYLGKARLEHAIAKVPELDGTVRWRPYQLDPSVPPEGMDRGEYMAKKFGDLKALEGAHKGWSTWAAPRASSTTSKHRSARRTRSMRTG